MKLAFQYVFKVLAKHTFDAELPIYSDFLYSALRSELIVFSLSGWVKKLMCRKNN